MTDLSMTRTRSLPPAFAVAARGANSFMITLDATALHVALLAEFYTATLIKLLEVVEVISAHERMQLVSKVRASAGLPGNEPVALLSAYPA